MYSDIWFLLVLVCPLSAIITVYVAHMYGRRFWPWLVFGFCVPLLSAFIALALAMRDARREAAADKREEEK
ncbi:hypothetical protein [Hymenobacter weizhouensis]|uniref:hypothetical protein n=1 Tax=Hymenobacter sp. YIM 151500-1 TaxID=2987689 RepID=UPI00222804FC|nr:hypothetical protein [Hymenobacter sp. YIM 151500-1]UYZ63573.1 hypothetical protein OIS53_01720 [Hymenobacter sp. YIM 151500-1]